jgi:hypothetical protein
MNLEMNIVAVATSYIGEREVKNNLGFKNDFFEKKMEAVGWRKGEAWCSYFAELVWKEALPRHDCQLRGLVDKLFSASATRTYQNFDVHPEFETGITPLPGAVAIWRLGNGWQGHAGIVTRVLKTGNFYSIEGNTNSTGGREGIEVSLKLRHSKKPYEANGLNLVGFIYPPRITDKNEKG